jgi:hypothetical protein
VNASASPSGTAAQTLRPGGNSRKQQRRPLDVPPIVVGFDTSLPREATCGSCASEVTPEQPHELGTAPVVVPNAGRTFPREGSMQIRPSEGNFRGTTESARITPVVAPNACRAVFRDGAGQVQYAGGDSSAATPSARVTPVVGVRMRAAPLSGGSVAYLTCWGQPWHNPRRVRESRLSWPLDRGAALSGAAMRIRSPGACSRAATLRESEDCACRGLDACCDLFGGCRTAPKQRTHLRCCHAPCEISRRTSGYGSCLSRETGLRPDASACLGRAFLGRCGETCASFWRCL